MGLSGYCRRALCCPGLAVCLKHLQLHTDLLAEVVPSCTSFIPVAFACSGYCDCHPERTCSMELNRKWWEVFRESRPHQPESTLWCGEASWGSPQPIFSCIEFPSHGLSFWDISLTYMSFEHHVLLAKIQVMWSRTVIRHGKKSRLKAFYHLRTADSLAADVVVVDFFVVMFLSSRSPPGSVSLVTLTINRMYSPVYRWTCDSILFLPPLSC